MSSGRRSTRVTRIACLALVAVIAAACGSDNKASTATTAKASASTAAGAAPTQGAASTAAAATTAAATTAAAAKPYSVSVAFPNDVESLDPQKIQDAPARTVYGNIFEPLLRRSVDGTQLQPLLAASMPTTSDSTTWTVKLRTDVKFASGKPLTADDVVYSFNRILDPKTDSDQSKLLNTITSTTAVDASTVQFKTKGPDPLLPSRLAYALIVPKGQGEVAGFPEKGLDGSGPYALDHHTAGVEVVLKKRSDYWGGALPSAPTQFTYKVIADASAELAALQANELDIDVSITPDQASQVPQSKTIIATESGLVRTNSLKGPFANADLRKAANLAIDRAAIVKSLFKGQGQVSSCQIATPQVFGHTASMKPTTQDVAQAKQLVKANYKGEPIVMYAVGRFAGLNDIGQAVAQNLKDVGFNVDLESPTSQDTLVAQFAGDKSKYIDLMLYQSSAEVFFDEAQQLQWLTSDGLYSTINDPALDALAKTATTSLDTSTRQTAYDGLNKLACDNSYNLYLYYPPAIYGLSKNIDWTPRADGLVLAQDIKPKS